METKANVYPTGGHNTRSVQLVLVRANGALFYSAAVATLLESDAVSQAERLLQAVAEDRELCTWIETEWLPVKLARARELREYVQSTWSEFAWTAVHEEYQTIDRVLITRPTAAEEALARCVASAQSSVFYRSLGRWAEDPRLREMARRYAHEEALAFARLRPIYEVCARRQRLRLAHAWRTAFSCVKSARDAHVARAFRAVNNQCGPTVPFNMLSYQEFIGRILAVVQRHGALGMLERMLLSAWKAQPRVAQIQQRRPAGPSWFKPLFQAAA
jgi:hypothetical protein